MMETVYWQRAPEILDGYKAHEPRFITSSVPQVYQLLSFAIIPVPREKELGISS